ncbi:unnamed protein product, partial [Mycena citricolor]
MQEGQRAREPGVNMCQAAEGHMCERPGTCSSLTRNVK